MVCKITSCLARSAPNLSLLLLRLSLRVLSGRFRGLVEEKSYILQTDLKIQNVLLVAAFSSWKLRVSPGMSKK